MTKPLTEFEYILESPISIHKSGEVIEAKCLTLKAPSNQNRYYITKLRQGFVQAQNDYQKSILSLDAKKLQEIASTLERPKENEDENLVSKGIIEMLYASSIDMNVYFDNFKKLLCDGVCIVEGNIKLTEHLFNQISINDGDQLLGRYIEVFMTSSSTKK